MSPDSEGQTPSRPTQDAGDQRAGAHESSVRRYWRWIVGVLVAFGILGAIGSRVVDWGASTVEKKIHPEKPLLIGVREDPHGGLDGFQLAARSSAGLDAKLRVDPELRGSQACDALFNAAKAAGAADVYKATERLILEGGTLRDVAILNMRAKIVKRGVPSSAASIRCESAGAVGGIGILFDLDKQDPVALKLIDGEALTTAGPYFAQGNIIKLIKGETQGFEVVGLAKYSYVEWTIEADVMIDEKEETITITNHGRPFRVTGPRDLKSGYQRYYEYQWYKVPPRMYIGNKSPLP